MIYLEYLGMVKLGVNFLNFIPLITFCTNFINLNLIFFSWSLKDNGFATWEAIGGFTPEFGKSNRRATNIFDSSLKSYWLGGQDSFGNAPIQNEVKIEFHDVIEISSLSIVTPPGMNEIYDSGNMVKNKKLFFLDTKLKSLLNNQ